MTSPGVRDRLKRIAERTLVAAGGPSLLRTWNRGRGVILAYHNVIPDGAEPGGDRSLHLPRSDFARQMDRLAATHRVVRLTELLEATGSRGRRPLAAITFDDGYRGALTVGLRELEARSLPATFFVSPGLLGREALWWDELAEEARRVLPEAWATTAQEEARGVQDEVLRWAQARRVGTTAQPGHAGVITEEELEAASRSPVVTLASHTWSHPNVTALDAAELESELVRPLRWLRERFPGRTVPLLSWPYGRSDDAARRASRAAGYERVFRIEGGLVGRGGGDFELPRTNVPAGASLERFSLLTAGV